MSNVLQTPIEFLKGVGPNRARLLGNELKIKTFEDLLHLFPFRYVDRSRFYKIKEIRSAETEVQIVGKIVHLEEVPTKKGMSRLNGTFRDETGSINLVWFRGVKALKSVLKTNYKYVLYGKPKIFNNQFSFPHPDLELLEDFKKSPLKGLQPIYPSTEKLTKSGLNSRGIAKLTKVLLPKLENQIPEFYPADFQKKHQLGPLEKSYFEVHFPKNMERLEKARHRLKFDEFFFMQMEAFRQKALHKKNYKGFVLKSVGENFTNFYQNILPFELTNAQKRVLKEVRFDMKNGHHLNRLVQGDVGSGKTIVALMAMLLAIDNGFQTCLMAPTEILANQHFNGISELTKDLPIEVNLLTGSVKSPERRLIHEKLQNGKLHILIGTHALIEEKVKFKNLGLAVVDEQHRFGVAQRAALWKKNRLPPHVLVMTATPIPRTLAMTAYGHLDISVIDELPPGRKPIKTVHRYDAHRLQVFGFLKDEIKKGRQIYIVYPLIEESEKLDLKDLMDGYESIERAFPKPDFQIGIVHGRMKPEDKDWEMQRFAKGETHILVATTVIEVGVNVPNASVMVIENAERFGLSQLHQLRGRVGRGAEKSYCILMTKNQLSENAKTRISTMVRTNDGFQIAETDMKLRGPGDMMGTRQSGDLNLQIADIMQDTEILQQARKAVETMLKEDPTLALSKHQAVWAAFQRRAKDRLKWGRIS